VIANQVAGLFGGGVPPVVPGDYQSIATSTPSGTGTVTFSSIPSTYKHLEIRYIAATASGTSYLIMKLNSDSTSSNYSSHYLFGTGASAIAGGGASRIGDLSVAPNSSTIFGAGIVSILDYTSTTKNKVSRIFSGYEQNTIDCGVNFSSQNWMNSSTAVSTITFTLDNAANFRAGTHFALYGVK
jgi:hypothetical protein